MLGQRQDSNCSHAHYMAFPEKGKMAGVPCSWCTLPQGPRQWKTVIDKPPKAILSMSHRAASFWPTPLELGSSGIANFDCSILLGLRLSSHLAPITHLLLLFLWLLPVFFLKVVFLEATSQLCLLHLRYVFQKSRKGWETAVEWCKMDSIFLFVAYAECVDAYEF